MILLSANSVYASSLVQYGEARISPTSLEPEWLRTEFSVARFMLLLLLLLLMLLMFFADEHYVCSSVACLLCNTPKARYPHKCGVTAPL